MTRITPRPVRAEPVEALPSFDFRLRGRTALRQAQGKPVWGLRRLFFTLALLFTAPLLAHLTPNSEVALDFNADHILVDAIIPEGDYRTAANAPARRDTAFAARWLAGQVAATSPDGRAWRVTVESAEFVQRAGPPDLHSIIRLTPPPGASPRALTLRWSAVVAQTPDHFALLLVGADHGAGVIRDDRALIGAVRGAQQTVTIDRGAPSIWGGFRAAFRLGMHHIAEGTDHILFLLALLLPAPLIASAARWSGPRPVRSALWKLAGTITAFTLGHSLTLVVAALTAVQLPAQPVELLIAVSILIAAIHAIRPIFPGREPWVAAGFGLVHGLAFATLIGDAGLGGGDRLMAILGFNLGIEAIQIGVAALAIAPLLLIAPTPAYRVVRIAGALFAAVAALAWIAERASGIDNALTGAIDAVAAQAHWLFAGLIVLALLARWNFRATAINSR
jgi:HupE / UreJ protein